MSKTDRLRRSKNASLLSGADDELTSLDEVVLELFVEEDGWAEVWYGVVDGVLGELGSQGVNDTLVLTRLCGW